MFPALQTGNYTKQGFGTVADSVGAHTSYGQSLSNLSQCGTYFCFKIEVTLHRTVSNEMEFSLLLQILNDNGDHDVGKKTFDAANGGNDIDIGCHGHDI